ncbi:hypothetical protein CVT26_001223 [Gymnopilus dilepis]|uniref:Uncharacterized protein n=1 Tax=Gymnopilus dilepis TaxID=231916 RepID=A0A409WBF5_9AGAR|nr:hypothetical protein CVT26_001223 [Gymnopilus dilepis]
MSDPSPENQYQPSSQTQSSSNTPAPPPAPIASSPAPNPPAELTSNGSNPAAPNPEPSSSTPSDPVNSVEIQSRCNAIIESYRSGRLAKAAAILKIQQSIVSAGPPASGNAAYKALEAYIGILDNFDAFRNSAGERGAALAGGPEHAGDQPEGEHGREAVEEEVLQAQKRSRQVVQEENSPSNLSPELRKTIAALEHFARDPKLAKASLLNSPRCPQSPDSEWTNLIAGCVIDFDHVFSGVYSIAADSRSRERFATLDVVTGTSAPARHVKSHSDFVMAWENRISLSHHPFQQGRNILLTVIQTTNASWTSVRSGSNLEGLAEAPDLWEVAVPVVAGKLADGGIAGSAPTLLLPATMPISAPNVEEQDTSPMPLMTAILSTDSPSHTTDHACRLGVIWSPVHELNDRVLSTTIASNPDLVAITPVRISTLRNLLETHPNQSFVDSICDGLAHGFWPWANTADSNLPTSLDVDEDVKEPAHVTFAEQQRAIEVAFGTFSPTFSTLLPGMLMQSPSPATQTSLVCARKARARLGPDVRLVVWKSDVERAYRIIPMSPYWQAKQVVKINGSYNVDRNNILGGTVGGRHLFAFVADSFSWDVEGNLVLYKKYNQLLPVKQALPGRCLPLSSFRELAGWINWALNVYPLLRPGLCTLYEKRKGETGASAVLRVGVQLGRELMSC